MKSYIRRVASVISEKERLDDNSKKAVLALWKLYKAMSNTVDSLIINREDIPSADQWINDLESDMKVVKEWISALSDNY